jgi:anti-sigma B factor antagonist
MPATAGLDEALLGHLDAVRRAAAVSELCVTTRHVGRRAVIAPTGTIDVATAPELWRACEASLRAGALEVWLDLGQTEFMDSSGLKVVLGLRRRVDELRRRLAIVCPLGRVRRVFELAGVDSALPLHTSLADAQRRT